MSKEQCLSSNYKLSINGNSGMEYNRLTRVSNDAFFSVIKKVSLNYSIQIMNVYECNLFY